MSGSSSNPRWIRHLLDNPLVSRTVRYGHRPSLRGTAWLAAGLALFSLAASLYSFVLNRGRWTPANAALLYTAWAVTLLSPLATTAVAVNLTASEARSQKGQLVRLSLLPEATLAQGYFFNTLYRLRLLLAVEVGLAPILVVGMMHLHIRYRFATICYPGSSCGAAAVMRPPHVSGPLIVFSGVVLAAMGLNLLGAGLGVWLALWARRAAEIVTAAVVLVCLVAAALSAAALLKDAAALPYDNPWMVLAFVLPAWVPYALALGVMRLTSRHMRVLPILV